jgi:glycerate kinase
VTSAPRLVVVAPDSFKGSLSAVEAAAAMERGVRAAWPDARVVKIPIADGGEGTVEAMVSATGGRYETRTVRGPLGRPVEARWGVLGDGRTAVVEMAAASGLTLVPEGRRDPRVATTHGTGQLIRAALDAGFRHIVVGIGGSATNDGGSGMARALGVRFLDGRGHPLPEGGAALLRVDSIDLSGIDPRLAGTELLVACDVDNPLTGPQGASAVYGPQKGATPAVVLELDAALERYAEVARKATGRDVARLPGAGAAGGLGAGLLFFTPARLVPGVDLVLDSARLERRRSRRHPGRDRRGLHRPPDGHGKGAGRRGSRGPAARGPGPARVGKPRAGGGRCPGTRDLTDRGSGAARDARRGGHVARRGTPRGSRFKVPAGLTPSACFSSSK